MSEVDQQVVKGLQALRGACLYTGALYEMGKISLLELQKSLTSVLVSSGLGAVSAQPWPPPSEGPTPPTEKPTAAAPSPQPQKKAGVPARLPSGKLVEPFQGRTKRRQVRTKAVNFYPNVERILELCVLGKSNVEIGKLTNVSAATVYRIRNRSANVQHHYPRIDAFLADHPGVDLHRGDRPPMSDTGKKNISEALMGHIPWNKGLRGVKNRQEIKA